MIVQKSEIESHVIVTERVVLPLATISGLLETVRGTMTQGHRVVSLLYRRGEPLTVERQVPVSEYELHDDFMTPFQVIRQHASIRVLESGFTPVEAVFYAAQLLVDTGYPPTAIVCRARSRMDEWIRLRAKVDQVLRISLYEDPDVAADQLFLCGSSTGPMVRDIEHAVLCRME